MKLQDLSAIRRTLDVFDERFYDLKDAILEEMPVVHLENSLERSMDDVMLLFVKIKSRSTVMISKEEKEFYMKELQSKIADCANLPEEELMTKTKSRKSKLVVPKQIHMALLYETFGITNDEASAIHGRTPATCTHSRGEVKNLYRSDKFYREKYAEVFSFCMEFDVKIGRKGTTERYLKG